MLRALALPVFGVFLLVRVTWRTKLNRPPAPLFFFLCYYSETGGRAAPVMLVVFVTRLIYSLLGLFIASFGGDYFF